MADTSIKAYHEIKAEGKISDEQKLVLDIMTNKGFPLSSLDIMKITKKERGNITRALYDLIKVNKVEISHKDNCPITGRTVRYYKLSPVGAPVTVKSQSERSST